ncbi:hypothetical protein TNCV_4987631 [Trichonephila clavipes]|nr:hypothetical protein TNCV_4987631 [Trichonephila clavipes]
MSFGRLLSSGLVKFITEAASSNPSLIKSLDLDKPAAFAASWKVAYLVPLIVNKSSYETTPFSSHATILMQEMIAIFFCESLQ